MEVGTWTEWDRLDEVFPRRLIANLLHIVDIRYLLHIMKVDTDFSVGSNHLVRLLLEG